MHQRAELAYDQRKEVERRFALEAMQRAAVVRREMAVRAPPPVPHQHREHQVWLIELPERPSPVVQTPRGRRATKESAVMGTAAI